MKMNHADKVDAIAQKVRAYYATKTPFRIYHGTTNSTRVVSFDRDKMVDTSELNQVVHVDTEKQIVVVEPSVPMDQLVKETLKYGLIPPVVTEFPGITVGGAIQGGAIESSSFRWGTFNQTVISIEMVLANGDVVTVSPEEHADLFYGSAGSYGTFGIITSATVQLVPAKRYVTLTTHAVTSFADCLETTNRFIASSVDFVESAMLEKGLGSVVVGSMSDKIVGKKMRFSRAWNPWYYMYIEKVTRAKHQVTVTMPLKDYLFRYDRGAFWAAEFAFRQSGIPFNAFTRFILNPILKTRKLYQAVQQSAAGQKFVCQDIAMPARTLVEFMDFVDQELGTYPTGYCAVKADDRSPLLFSGIKGVEQVYSVGVYGLRISEYDKFVTLNRKLEKATHRLGGRKWFYAHTYYTEDEFWSIYDKKWYDSLRKKYHADTLPSVTDKIIVREHYEVRTRRAALKAVVSKPKLRINDDETRL